jgi:hypothetical protein
MITIIINNKIITVNLVPKLLDEMINRECAEADWRKCRMIDLIVADQFGIDIQCLYYGYKKENLVCNSVSLKQGDLLEITNQGRYIVGVGWFVLIRINNKIEEFMWVKELEEAIHVEKIMNSTDCLLQYFSVSYQLDQSLACRNKEKFLSLLGRKKELSFLYDQLCGKVLVES